MPKCVGDCSFLNLFFSRSNDDSSCPYLLSNFGLFMIGSFMPSLVGGGVVSNLAQVLTQLITFGQSTNVSVEAPRFHIGPTPRFILLEGQ